MKNLLARILLILLVILAAGFVGNIFKTQSPTSSDGRSESYVYNSFSGDEIESIGLETLSESVKDDYKYFGLSVYLGNVIPVSINQQGVSRSVAVSDDELTLVEEEWVGFRGRFKTVLIRAPNASIHIDSERVTLDWAQGVEPKLDMIRANHDDFRESNEGLNLPNMGRLQYIHLPKFIQYLCHFVEWLYKALVNFTHIGWGVGLFLFALTVRILMWPISSLTKKYQSVVNEHRVHLAPVHADIKKTLKGEKAHSALMKTYKERGITPYFTLKPLMITMIGLPILIAIFNMLGEVNVLDKSPFLWIDNLAYPDHLATLPFSVPFFGNRFNLLPFLMALITIFSALTLRDKNLLSHDLKRQKRNLFGMALLFFMLFYNFPSGMVLYWTIASTFALVLAKE